MIRTVVTAVAGRMGQAITRALAAAPREFTLCGATERQSGAIGRSVRDICGVGPSDIAIHATLDEALDALAAQGSRADVAIDFSHPSATLANARACARHGTALVIGTTGLSPETTQALDSLSAHIPLLRAPNMSVGVVLMQKLVSQAARALGEDYDIEIMELHHRHKRDAPSGTALRLGNIAAEALGRPPADSLRLSREGDIGPRTDREIGVQTLRGGDCAGEHTVFFIGQGERLEITHRAMNREQFALGALRAARYLVGKEAGRYGMADVLGLCD